MEVLYSYDVGPATVAKREDGWFDATYDGAALAAGVAEPVAVRAAQDVARRVAALGPLVGEKVAYVETIDEEFLAADERRTRLGAIRLVEGDARLRGELTAEQRGELDDEEVVVDLRDGWAETHGGVFVTADGARVLGPGSGRSPRDAADLAALARAGR